MDRRQEIDRLIAAAERRAEEIGVGLIVEWQEEQERLTFTVARRDGRPGAGAEALRHLLELADDAGIDIAIDVFKSAPALIRYYWALGFRMTDGDEDGERRELVRVEAERDGFLSRPGNAEKDLPVTFMWRDAPRARTTLAA